MLINGKKKAELGEKLMIPNILAHKFSIYCSQTDQTSRVSSNNAYRNEDCCRSKSQTSDIGEFHWDCVLSLSQSSNLASVEDTISMSK